MARARLAHFLPAPVLSTYRAEERDTTSKQGTAKEPSFFKIGFSDLKKMYWISLGQNF